MRISLFFIGVLCFACLSVAGQNRHLTDSERKELQEYIRRDTLPVDVKVLPSTINSHFSEYAGTLYPDSTLLFTSMRADRDEDYDHFFETSWYCKIYSSHLLPDGNYTLPTALPSIINSHNYFNSNYFYDYHNHDFIYSRCKRDKEGDLKCELWQSTYDSRGWSKPKKLPSPINEPGTTSMQPFVVHTDEYNILYFVSDRANGIGGLDIWYSTYKNGVFNAPINAGTVINTEGNEITPFYDTVKKVLYFSSDEHLGLGGYDIFYCEGSMGWWEERSNMGVPFNSEYNDYYFTLTSKPMQGYFSSNRPQEYGVLEDTCCNDLFFFEWRLPTDTILSEKTADTMTLREKIASVLPITLYFENDEPNPRSVSDTTQTNYLVLFEKYLEDTKQYLSTASNKNASSNLAQQQMARFFSDSIQTGHDRLIQLTQYLKEALLKGEAITLDISGFASPLHNKEYNQHLSARRIVSLLNYLRTAENGFFTPYLEGKKNGLVINTNPQGAIEHRFQTNNIQETVYGVQAARDRKIVISAQPQ